MKLRNKHGSLVRVRSGPMIFIVTMVKFLALIILTIISFTFQLSSKLHVLALVHFVLLIFLIFMNQGVKFLL